MMHCTSLYMDTPLPRTWDLTVQPPRPTPNDIEWLLKHVRRQAVGTHPTGMLSCLSCTWNITRFPLGMENLQKWEGIFQSGKSQGILNRLEKSGQEFQTNIICYFSVIFK